MSRENSAPDHVTPYDRFAWSDTEIEGFLVSGEHQRDLIAYFGEREYGELRELARRAAQVSLAPGAIRVFVVPGIMGSQLGLRRTRPLPNDVLWLDPIDISVGRLELLRLSSGAPVVPLGVVLYSYLRLKLNLRASGFAPTLYDYDWRRGIDELGLALAERIRSDPAERVMIVAHSMGGLVSRSALAHRGMEKVARVVLMGTPNSGSYAPLQALRGTYAVVRKIASLASSSSAESLASEIFTGFPSLYHMLPGPQGARGIDLFDPRAWPRSGPRPDRALLRAARAIQGKLPPPDDRFATVVGTGQETVTAVIRRKDDFVYTITRRGDGTVPAASAELPGARNHYARVAHSDLTRDPTVATAVTELLRDGATRRLASKWRSGSAAQAQISDRQLRRFHSMKVDWVHLEPQQRLMFLQNLNEPPKLKLRVAARGLGRKASGSKPARASGRVRAAPARGGIRPARKGG